MCKIKNIRIILLLVGNVYWLESGVSNYLHAIVVRNIKRISLSLKSLLLLNDRLSFILLLLLKDSQLSFHAADRLIHLLRRLKKVINLCPLILDNFELLNLLLTNNARSKFDFLPGFDNNAIILLVNHYDFFANSTGFFELLYQGFLTQGF